MNTICQKIFRNNQKEIQNLFIFFVLESNAAEISMGKPKLAWDKKQFNTV